MKIACISDTHLRHERYSIDVPECDLLLHSGDACLEGTQEEVVAFFRWFKALPAKHKIFVAGNHDWLFQKDPEAAEKLVPDNVHYLEDSMIEIGGLRIWGSPWQPEFQNWAFNLPRGKILLEKWKQIPTGIDILVTHGPPSGILDFSKFGNEHVGCQDLRREMERIKPKVHVFGHIHGSYGIVQTPQTLFVNAAVCDESYVASNPPVMVEWEEGKPLKATNCSGILPERSAKPIRLSTPRLWN